MKKFTNFRPFLFIAVALIIGIYFMSEFIVGNFSLMSVLVLAGILFVFLVFSIVFMIVFKSDFILKRFFKRLLIFICAIVLGVGSVGLKSSFMKSIAPEYSTYTIVGRLVEEPSVNDKSYIKTLILDDVYITDEKTGESFSVKFKTMITASGDFSYFNATLGNIIETKAYLYATNNSQYTLINNNIFTCGKVIDNVNVLDGKKVNIFEYTKLHAKDILFSSMDEKYAGIAYGMLFGDKSYMDNQTINTFNDAGVSHLLAVSGLHVGFVVFLLDLILGLFKVKNKTRFFVVTGVLFLYMIFCNFAVSVVRAFIMTACMLYCRMREKTYDSLSALSFACIILLFINPFELFNIGFRLSFMAVLGIILLCPILSKFFSFFLFENFASSLALSLSASIGIMPVMSLHFGKISLLSVMTNMIVIPIASISFMILFVTLIISMIIPSISVIVMPFQWIMSFVYGVASIASGISINNLDVSSQVGIIALFLSGMFISSNYVIAKLRTKLIFLACVTCICSIIIFI